MTPLFHLGQLPSAQKQVVHLTRRTLATKSGGRRLAAAELLQLLDPRPGRGALAPVQRDERLELGTGELGHVGTDRWLRERWTLHAFHREPASYQNDVWTLLTGQVLSRAHCA